MSAAPSRWSLLWPRCRWVELHHMVPVQTHQEVSITFPLCAFVSLQVPLSVPITPGEVNHHVLNVLGMGKYPIRLVVIKVGVHVRENTTSSTHRCLLECLPPLG